jgi:hypothetical protein
VILCASLAFVRIFIQTDTAFVFVCLIAYLNLVFSAPDHNPTAQVSVVFVAETAWKYLAVAQWGERATASQYSGY